MTDRVLVIHPGMAKAGSTVLQYGWSHYREPLLRRDVWYPQGSTSRYAHHYLFIHGSVFESPSATATSETQLWMDLAAAAKQLKVKHTLLSSEFLFARCQEDGYLERLGEIVRATGAWDQVKFVIILRHQIDFMQSAFGEALRGPDWRHVLPAKDYVSWAHTTLIKMADKSRVGHIRVEPNYINQIAAFQSIFPSASITGLDYETVRASVNGIVPAFLKAADLPLLDDTETRKLNLKQNVSTNPMSMIVAQCLGARLQPEIEAVIEAEVRKLYPEAASTTIFTRSELMKLKLHFSNLNQDLSSQNSILNLIS